MVLPEKGVKAHGIHYHYIRPGWITMLIHIDIATIIENGGSQTVF
jgi:hypothetical protein